MTSQNSEEAGLITALPDITEVGWTGMRGDTTRGEGMGGKRARMSDVIIIISAFSTCKTFPTADHRQI